MGLLRFLKRSRWDRERREELESYVQIEADENIARGMPANEARAAARRKLGNTTLIREEIYRMNTVSFLGAASRDFRYAMRAFRRNPMFTLTALLTLALGIAATTSMFSVVDGVLIRPLPYPEQHRLVELVHEAPGLGINELFASPAIYFTYREYSRAFDSVGLWDWDQSPSTVTGLGEPEAVQSLAVTHEFFGILGATPVFGRGFMEADDLPGSTPTVLLSYGYWRRHFGGADGLGKTLIVDGIPRQVIGVLPQSFRFFDYPAEIFYSLQPVRSTARFPSFDGRGIARLKAGVTLESANADIRRMIPTLNSEFGPGFDDSARFGPRLRLLKDSVVGNLAGTLWLLMATIGFLLLIACANVANLVLVRTQARRQELAIRAALGAGWRGIARLIFTESLILGLSGGAAGLALAYVSVPGLVSASAGDLPQISPVTINSTVALVAFGISLLAGLMFASILAIHLVSNGVHAGSALHSGGRSMTAGRESHRMQRLLVLSQVSVALVLLIGAGLLIQTYWRLQQVDPGFRDPEKVQILQLTIPLADVDDPKNPGVPDPERTFRMQNAIQDRLAGVAGVESVGFAVFNDALPMDGDGRGGSIIIDGRPPAEEVGVEIQFVSPKFFETLQTPLLAGRSLEWADVYQNHPVTLISENLARAEWGSVAGALGKRIGGSPAGPWWEVVGVIADVYHNGLNQPAPKTVSLRLPVTQRVSAIRTATFVVRSRRVGAPGFLEELQKAAWSVNRNVALGRLQTLGVLGNVQTLGDLYRRSVARTSTSLMLLSITGVMALALGLIGIYGVVSYSVSHRRREVGIRLALGARPGELRWFFVKEILAIVIAGALVGIVGAAGLTHLITSQLFRVSPLDSWTYAAVAIGLVAAALFAAYLPSRRASAIDPVEALKAD